MKTLKPVNVAIVGGGWTGLAMAKEITGRTSLSVLVLERGAPRKTTDYVQGMDELDYAIRTRLMQNIAEETITHRHSVRDPSVPVRQYGSFLPGSGVGGAGEHWNGQFLSFPRNPISYLANPLERKVRSGASARKSGGSGLGGYLRRSRTILLARRTDDGRQRQSRQYSRTKTEPAATFSRDLE